MFFKNRFVDVKIKDLPALPPPKEVDGGNLTLNFPMGRYGLLHISGKASLRQKF